uniref:Uncharacterized protein n=2 Tax=Caenorhabditis japonica TaxID=281687 RepID=A0A8R1IHW4_CAEJA
MERTIDHDEEGRESSEYEDMDDEDDEFRKELEFPPPQQQQFIEDQLPTSSGHHLDEIPAAMNIEYEGLENCMSPALKKTGIS